MAKRILTETFLKALAKKPPAAMTTYSEPGRVGFQLRHWPGGALTFVLRYQREGREAVFALGNYPATSLEAAHEAHSEARKLLGRGIDPAEERERTAKARNAQTRSDRLRDAVTVRNVIAEWAWHHARRQRKRPREAIRLLRTFLKPWEGRPARELTRRDAVLLTDPIAARAPVLVNRYRDLASQAFTFAVRRELLPMNPFLGLSKPGGAEKPKERSLNADEIKAAWAGLASSETKISASVRLCLKLILVSAQRPGEVIGAQWSEFDLEGATWTIPPERAKNGKEHQVPLSGLALELLAELKTLAKGRPAVAPSHQSKKRPDDPLSERALSRALRNNHKGGKLFGSAPWTPHDLRRTAASQMTASGTPRLHVAKILNHADSEITGVYDRHDYATEKREALVRWATDLRQILAGKRPKVLAIKRHAA